MKNSPRRASRTGAAQTASGRAGAGCDGKQFNVTQAEIKLREQALDHPEQRHRVVRAAQVPRAGQALPVAIDRGAAMLARCVKSQDQHDHRQPDSRVAGSAGVPPAIGDP